MLAEDHSLSDKFNPTSFSMNTHSVPKAVSVFLWLELSYLKVRVSSISSASCIINNLLFLFSPSHSLLLHTHIAYQTLVNEKISHQILWTFINSTVFSELTVKYYTVKLCKCTVHSMAELEVTAFCLLSTQSLY